MIEVPLYRLPSKGSRWVDAGGVLNGYGKREFKHTWREAGPPNHHDDKVDSDQ